MSKDVSLINPHTWVQNYSDYLYAFALSRLRDESIARDMVQETFLSALEMQQSFKGNSSERTWLTAILKNKIIDLFRKKSSSFKKAETEDISFFEDNGHWTEENQPISFGIEDRRLEHKEFNKILKLCLEKLPALWFAVFTMKLIDEDETEKICEELKISSSNFWVVMHRSKLNLRACLQKHWL